MFLFLKYKNKFFNRPVVVGGHTWNIEATYETSFVRFPSLI